MRETDLRLTAEMNSVQDGPWNPDTVKACTGERIWWICSNESIEKAGQTTCSHQWKATGARRADRTVKGKAIKGSGCPYCSGQAVHTGGRNCMRNTHPLLAAEWDTTRNGDRTPDNTIAGTSASIAWECSTCSHQWKAKGDSRVNGSGCPSCAVTGFNPAELGYLYISKLQIEGKTYYKIGIANRNPTVRCGQMLVSMKDKHGASATAEVHETIQFPVGKDARTHETWWHASATRIKEWLLPNFDGYTEVHTEEVLELWHEKYGTPEYDGQRNKHTEMKAKAAFVKSKQSVEQQVEQHDGPEFDGQRNKHMPGRAKT
jgi:hypothetical protein